MKTKKIMALWAEWQLAADKLIRVLHEQTVAVTLRDVDRVEKIQPDLEAFTRQIREIDAQALQEAKILAEELGVPASSLRSLISGLDKTEGQNLQATANKVLQLSQKIQEVISKNRKLMESEMTYINGTLTLIAKAAVTEKGPYRTRKSSNKSVLVDAAA